jgi:PEP-CTERM motif-containing protein
VRKYSWIIALVVLATPAWADSLQFHGNNPGGDGLVSFTPGLGNELTIGAGNGALGALVTDVFNSSGLCGGDCTITGGYATLKSGAETSGFSGGGTFSYTYGAGGTLDIYGGIASLGISNGSLLFSASFLTGATFSGAGTIASYIGPIDLGSISLNPNLGTYTYSGGSSDELSLSISASCDAGGLCTGPITESDTTLEGTTVPEPSSLVLLGFGLSGLAGMIRRKLHA